ncbi:MAG: thioesterase family protein [Pseudomonadales bacterium]
MPFKRCYQGSVNRWECDENDHLNVRFYLQKVHQALVIAGQEFGLLPATDANTLLAALDTHHIRFLREARIAVPLTGECAIVAWDAPHLQTFTQLTHSLTGAVMATFISDFRLPDSAVLADFAPQLMAVPDYGAPRGINAERSPYAALDHQRATQHGYEAIGAGVIQTDECDDHGYLLPWHYMGRTSDAMPNFWSRMQSLEDLEARSDGFVGGAVLEYRMQFGRRLRSGDAYSHLGAVGEIGNKTQQIGHLLYHNASGDLVICAEALGISLDLQTRKSVAIPEARRDRMRKLQRRAIAKA